MILNAVDKKILSLFEKNLIRSLLEEDGIVAFPSDTVYGLGVNGFSSHAVARLYQLKKRQNTKPLILLTDDPQKVSSYLLDPEELRHPLVQKYWPGALTIVFNVKDNIPLHYATQKEASLGIRVPCHSLLLDLLAFLPFPLVTTSANISSQEPMETANAIEQKFNLPQQKDEIACIIDGGNLKQVASTVVQLVGNEVLILRKGSIKFHDASFS